jgi:DNA-binding helix-hairpin-helix protein with protein kinase domain
MPTFYDSKGFSHVLTEQIGRGGEGTVFVCPNDDNLVAKIYHEPVTAEKAEKLRWMADNKKDHLLKVAAWIVDTLHDAPSGKTVGFLMPNVKAKEIHELYSLKSRRVYFPNATWQFLVHTAANLARAFYNLHKSEHIMGDVNHGNCVVLADGTVKLIDCDSYSIKKGDSHYRCEVGVATHLAPELQGKNLRDAERLCAHDNFGLAVIIFQLLFLGRHPFAGIYLGEEEKSLEDCIRELRFAYGKDAKSRQVKQPPGTLALSAVSPRIAEMFERAFLTEKRPEPQEWIEALEDLSDNLKQCGIHPGHHYFQELAACPWCEIEAKTGLMFFPFVSGNRSSDEDGFNIFTVESLISSLSIPQNLPALPPKPMGWVQPSPLARQVQKNVRNRLIALAVTQFLVTGAFVSVFGGCAVFIPSMIILGIFLVSFDNYNKSQKIDLEINLDTAEREWNKLEEEWSKAQSFSVLNNNLVEIRKRVNEYQNLHKVSRDKIKLLQDETFYRQLNDYLTSFRVIDSQISGIGEKNLTVLRSFGIKTAADITQNRLNSIPRTGDLIVQKLFDWRKKLERDFEYQPDIETSENSEKQIEREVVVLRQRIGREINNMLVPLRSMSLQTRQQQTQLSSKSEQTIKNLAQARNDFESIAMKIPAFITMAVIAMLMVFFGNYFHSPSVPVGFNNGSSGSSRNTYSSSNTVTARPATENSGIGSGSGSTNAYSENYKVPDSLTDEQIEAMTDWERQSAAKTLGKEATDLSYYDNNHKEAEKKLRLAVRLIKYDVNLFNQLAIVLYKQNKYKESLEFLNQSLKINSENTVAKLHIGKNYVKLGRFDEGRDTLMYVTSVMPSHESYCYLGLAHKGLGEDQSAITSFRKAVEFYPQDVESHFELGSALNKIGDKEGARAEYETLLGLDQAKAGKLKRIIGGK